MSIVSDVFAWFADPDNWTGPSGLLARLREHIVLSAAATGAAFLLTFPPATWLGHRRRGGFVFVNLANLGRAIPSLAILLLAVQWLGLEEWPVVGSVTAFLTLTALALAPIATNTYVGLRDVPDAVRESAAAMGFRGRQQVWRVELPLAAPLVITGVRTAAVAVVATATLAAYVGGGGLGRFIVDGMAVRAFDEVVAGALAVAALAVATDAVFGLATRRVLRHRRADRRPRRWSADV
jgi:osmoprotectant transport system permease protein